MSNEERPLRIAVIAGSRRPHRRSRAVAEWVCASSPAGTTLELVDLEAVGLPPLAEPAPAMSGEYALAHTRAWSELVVGFDAFVLVTPEYNHSTSAALKDAMDHLYREWQDKPVGFVGYGVDGGVRAVEHLRGITAELGMPGVGPSVALNIGEDLDEHGSVVARDRPQEQLGRMTTTLVRWAGALKPLREQAEKLDADEVTAALVATLQRGLDEGDADLYDSRFGPDVLWGTPYGETLAGFAPLNAAHRSMMATPRPGHSRYEIVQTARPAADVVVAHVRRRSLQEAPIGTAAFSETALYVLVRRDGRWWLAAGQNTPIRPKP